MIEEDFAAINDILMRRKTSVIITNTARDFDNVRAVIAIMKNIEAYGYTFGEDVFNALSMHDITWLSDFYKELVEIIKKLSGADKVYLPMYQNFPEQVADADASELFLNAIMHYWSCGEIFSDYVVEERMPLIDDIHLKKIELATFDDVYDIFTNLISSKTNLSQQDKQDVIMIADRMRIGKDVLPAEIPLKENVALIAKAYTDSKLNDVSDVYGYFKTPTDVLRFITALSDGDISLAANTKYKKMSRPQRRNVMEMLAGCDSDILEDMWRYKNKWIRVGEIVHPNEFKGDKFDCVRKSFNSIRNNVKPMFFSSFVEKAFKENDIRSAIELLKTRPGEFARNLDRVLRKSYDCRYALDSFENVADKVSIPVLLQVRAHFLGRIDKSDIRVFFPKGQMAKAKYIGNELPDINKQTCMRVVSICNNALVDQFKKKGPLGKVYLDEELRGILVPFSQRSASNANKTVIRGSRYNVKGDCNTVRGFIWWTNTEHDIVDIDLSATIYDSDWNYVDHISYTNLKSDELNAYHSGDIVNGGDIDGEGTAEFIDIDLNSIADSIRYVVFQVYSFNCQKFSELPNCRFGWMERECSGSGEIFEPSTVNMSIDLTFDATVGIPVVFDCVKREFIWCDIAGRANGGSRNNLENNLKGVTGLCYAMTEMGNIKPQLYDLILLNTIARGERVTSREDADIIFSNDEIKTVNNQMKHVNEKESESSIPIVTAYDFDYIVGNLM